MPATTETAPWATRNALAPLPASRTQASSREQHTAHHGEEAEGDQAEAGRVVGDEGDDQSEHGAGTARTIGHGPVRSTLRGVVLRNGHVTSLHDEHCPADLRPMKGKGQFTLRAQVPVAASRGGAPRDLA